METMMNTENNKTNTKVLNTQNLGKLKLKSIQDILQMKIDSPQIIRGQATMNIGLVGHVSHGKSTIIQAITGVRTAKYRDQIMDNHTKRLGFANAKIFKCPKCQAPSCYKSYPSDKQDNPACPNSGCTQNMNLVRHVSFCDCPGHDKFMSTMLTGASIFDSALLTIAGNMQCPQPQTAEHLNALQILEIKNTIIAQNKIDLIFHNRDLIRQNYKQIRSFMLESICKNSPIIPISAQLQYNIDALLQAICQIPPPQRLLHVPPIMNIIRSFDVNKPGTHFQAIKGGVVGGTILAGVLAVGMQVQLRPGFAERNKLGQTFYTPIKTKVVSLSTEKNSLDFAVPGGLIGVGLLVDPSLTRNNKMVGNILGEVGKLPELYSEVTIKFYLLKRVICSTGQNKKIDKIKEGEQLRINIKSCECEGKVNKILDDIMVIGLSRPACVDKGDKVAFSRRINSKYRLIGYGEFKFGENFLNKQEVQT